MHVVVVVAGNASSLAFLTCPCKKQGVLLSVLSLLCLYRSWSVPMQRLCWLYALQQTCPKQLRHWRCAQLESLATAVDKKIVNTKLTRSRRSRRSRSNRRSRSSSLMQPSVVLLVIQSSPGTAARPTAARDGPCLLMLCRHHPLLMWTASAPDAVLQQQQQQQQQLRKVPAPQPKVTVLVLLHSILKCSGSQVTMCHICVISLCNTR